MCFKVTSQGDPVCLFIGRGEDLLFMMHIAIKTSISESWCLIHTDPFQMLNLCCPDPLYFNLETLLEISLFNGASNKECISTCRRSLLQEIMHVCVWVGVYLPSLESSAFEVYLTSIAPCVEQSEMLPLLRNALYSWHKSPFSHTNIPGHSFFLLITLRFFPF